ncbi:MAG: hypothetical protein HY275_03275 [Gemmatimonadetes bacterium]|nr:hypothetical protein [Gemmatimonadota bacterium]
MRLRSSALLPLAALVLAGCAALGRGTPAAPATGADVVRAMRAKYDGTWYRTLTFVQKTTTFAPDGKPTVTTWYESIRAPEGGTTQLRIDTGDPAQGNGVLYTADSLRAFRGGKQVAYRAGGNALIPLVEAAYVQPVERTMAELAPTKVDFTRATVRGTWDGRAVWIVGATSAADTTSPQFWVDAENLMVLRAIFVPVAGAPLMDMRLGAVKPAGRGLLATRCDFYVQGKLVQVEEYLDWKADPALPDALFDPAAWSSAPHWAKPAAP